jgi:hypothetical protein
VEYNIQGKMGDHGKFQSFPVEQPAKDHASNAIQKDRSQGIPLPYS